MNRSVFVVVILLSVIGAGCKRGITEKGGSDPLSPGVSSSDSGPRTRSALVIGNSRYKQLQGLEACKNDAEMMAATFQKIGIALHGGKPLFDLTADQMDAAISSFARSLGRDSEAFFYFTGHGAQIGGSNYLLPVNFDAQYENQARRQAISLDAILETLEKTDSRLRVVILDACRDPGNLLPGEPLTKSGVRSKGLEAPQVEGYSETLVCFATKHGTVSLADNNASFYSRVLAEEMVKPAHVEDVLKVVTRRVLEETGGRQRPHTYGDLVQDHFFMKPLPVTTPRPAVAVATDSPASAPRIATPYPLPTATPPVKLAPAATPAPIEVARLPSPNAAAKPQLPQPTATEVSSSSSWPTFRPGEMPPGRTISVGEAGALADRKPGERLYLRGEFRVTASGANRAIMRDPAAKTAGNVRVIVEFPEGMLAPEERSVLTRDAKQPLEIREIRKAEDGEVTIYAREIIAQSPGSSPSPALPPPAVTTGLAKLENAKPPSVRQPGQPATAPQQAPFANSLGMQFVPVPGTKVLFSVWETRVQDYEVFVKATKRAWEKPPFQQGPTHPAVNVSWEDAVAFCEWLSAKEGRTYRLPTDAEWSVAVGLGVESGNTPDEKRLKAAGYPWGAAWPPPRGAGNYGFIDSKVDSFVQSAPVGSFAPNPFGLYDLGGNVWEWCEDLFSQGSRFRALRGGSLSCELETDLRSSARGLRPPATHADDNGFRCVVVASGG